MKTHILNQVEILEQKIKMYEMENSLDKFNMILESRRKNQELKDRSIESWSE